MKLVTKILVAVFVLAILTPFLYFMYLCQFKGKCDFISIHDVNNNNTYREGYALNDEVKLQGVSVSNMAIPVRGVTHFVSEN